MVKVEKVKFWTKNWNGKGGYGKEIRVYIDMSDGRRGGLFVTGNPYQEPGDIDGRITEEDIAEAKALCGGSWKTMYQDRIDTAYKLREIRSQA